MKIRSIRAAGLTGATPTGGWSNEIGPDDNLHTLVAVHTEDGLIGLGSVFTSEKLVLGSLELLNGLLIGESAVEPDRLTETLHQSTFWQGRGGAITHAISGINIALWDIMGQIVGQPIGRLLGGNYRNTVMPYASILVDDPEPLKASLGTLRAQGFRAFKIGWGKFGQVDSKTDREIVEAAREAIGSESMLMVDAGCSDPQRVNSLHWAIETSKMLAEYRVDWFEEPLSPDDLTGFESLQRASAVPISGGEALTRRQSFDPFLNARAFDIVQPDVTKVGGLSESFAIGKSAQAHNIRLVPHGWNTAVGLAADLQLAAALEHTDLVEYRPGSAYIDEIVVDAWSLDDHGRLAIPNGHGLGVEWDREQILKYTKGTDIFASTR